MRAAYLAAGGAAVAVAVAAAALLAAPADVERPKAYLNDFTFYDVDRVRDGLEGLGLGLSAPTAITDATRDQYCAYFEGGREETVPYCTTTAITGEGGTFGNFNMGGTPDGGPVMAIALAESDGPAPGRVAGVFEVVVESLVCECWAEERPGGFATVGDWMAEAGAQFAASDRDVPIKSRITGLDHKELVLELGIDDGAYLWSLTVLK